MVMGNNSPISDEALKEAVLLLEANGSVCAAAKACGMSQGGLHKRLMAACKRGLFSAVKYAKIRANNRGIVSPDDIITAAKQYSASGSITEAAEKAGVSRSVLARRLKKAGITHARKIEDSSSRFDRRMTSLADENSKLRAALKTAHREAGASEGLAAIMRMFHETPTSPPSWLNTAPPTHKGKVSPEVPVVCFADWHLGETVDPAEVNGANAYNLKIAGERVQRLVDGTINLCTRHHSGVYPGLVVCLLGDFVSGGLHPELLKTDEEEVIPATLRARDLLVGALRKLADQFGRLYVPMVAGNHGRHTAKPEFKRYIFKNFDWLIYQLLVREFAGDKRIQFDVRPSNDVHFRVYGQRYLAVHGDMLGVKGGDGIIGSIGPIMRGEVKKSGQSSSLGMQFDKLIMGHWHQRLWLPRATVSGTLKGFDEYARLQLGAKPDRPTQALWFVHPAHGETAHWDVYVDEAPKPSRDWISWAA